jgi:hypothetical protein
VDALDRQQLRPIEHPDLVRLGLPRDGGYVVPEGCVRHASVLLSLGMKEDWAFDRAFVRVNPRARVIAVDYSVGPRWFAQRFVTSLAAIGGCAFVPDRRKLRKSLAALRNAADYFRFFRGRHVHIRKRVAATDSADDISLATLLEFAGSGDTHSVFLKVDVEGAEYDLVAELVDRHAAIGCIVAEFHHIGRKTDAFNRAIARLLERFRIVHLHGNNYSAYDARIDFPDAVEITLIHASLLRASAEPLTRPLPRADLDRPNRPGRADHPLRFG